MYTFLIFLHVLVAILLIVVILMQSSKGGGLSGAFGGAGVGASQSLFGGRGAASFLQKITVGLAVMFMLLALVINMVGKADRNQRSVVQESAQQQQQEQQLSPGTSLPKPGGGTSGSEGLLPVQPGSQQGTQQQNVPVPAQPGDSGGL